MPVSLTPSASAGSVAPARFVFFSTDDHSLWRYLWPFLSAKQLITALALVGVALIGCIEVLPRTFVADARMAVFSAFFLTLVGTLHKQLPGKITIATTHGPARQLMPVLEPVVLMLGYVRRHTDTNGGCIRWRLAAVSCWSLLDSPEQDIELRIADENIIEVRGPKAILEAPVTGLRSKLKEAKGA